MAGIIATRIRALRKERGLSQDRLARLFGLSIEDLHDLFEAHGLEFAIEL